MGVETSIGWTDATINFWTGCKKVSPGCKFCYMYRDKERYGKDPTEVIRSNFDRVRAMVKKIPAGNRVFTCSWSDFFIEEADAWRDEAWEIIRDNPQFHWQVLTKRPERILANLPEDWGEGWSHVWLGVSVETQNQDSRVIELLNIPAKVRFISAEPLLDEVNLTEVGTDHGTFTEITNTLTGVTQKYIKGMLPGNFTVTKGAKIDWVIIGGESGNDTGKYLYRPCEIRWILDIVRHCVAANVPVFVKQLGTHIAKKLLLKSRHGSNPDEFPAFGYLKFQQFPN